MAEVSLDKHLFDNQGRIILTGSANAYVAATAESVTGYFEGFRICGRANFTNSGAATLNVNGIGAADIRKGATTALVSGDMISGKYYDFAYDAANSVFQLMGIQSTGAGSGDVTGPSSATDNAVARFDGTTGKLIQSSGIVIDDSNVMAGAKVLPTGASTARTLEAHFADTANVFDFGAVGDGVAADRASFVSAYTRAVAADVPMIVPGGNYNFASDYIPALTNIRMSISPDSEWNGAGLFKLDNLIPFQVTPVFAREYIGGIYDSSFSSFVGIFQNASFAKANLATTAVVAQFGEGEAAVASSLVWGGNFVGVASISGGTALALEINPVVTAAGGIAFGAVIASAGSQPSSAAIQIQSNTAASKFANGIIFNNTTNNATTGALVLGNTGSAAAGIDLSAMTFSTAEALFPSFVIGPTPGSINSQIRVDGGASNSAKISATGANADVVLQFAAKGASNIQFLSTLTPSANDGAALGVSGTAFSDLFLASGAVINFVAGDVTITHATNALAFAGATTNGYSFADGPIKPAANDGIALGVSGTAFSDAFFASGAVIDFAASDVTITHSANKLNFAGASSNYVFDTSIGAGGVTPAVTGFEAGFAGDTQIRLVSNGTVDTRMLASNGNSIGTIGTFTNHPLQFVSNSTERLRISGAGVLQFAAPSFTANGTAAVTITALRPAAAAVATITRWLSFLDEAGVDSYIPIWQ